MNKRDIARRPSTPPPSPSHDMPSLARAIEVMVVTLQQQSASMAQQPLHYNKRRLLDR